MDIACRCPIINLYLITTCACKHILHFKNSEQRNIDQTVKLTKKRKYCLLLLDLWQCFHESDRLFFFKRIRGNKT